MENQTIGKRISKLMTFYAMYSEMIDQIPEASAKDVDNMRERRNTYKRWIKEDLEALEALGSEVDGFKHLRV